MAGFRSWPALFNRLPAPSTDFVFNFRSAVFWLKTNDYNKLSMKMGAWESEKGIIYISLADMVIWHK